MSDTTDNVTALGQGRRLTDAIREVKNAAADRDDVVIEMREAERMRLELLAAELAPVIAEVPHDSDLFDFAISYGLQPRFWIDAVCHVAMGRDKRTFRFLRETRRGRVILAELTDMRTVANAVTRYLAERIVERERLMEGEIVDLPGMAGREQDARVRASSLAHAKEAAEAGIAAGEPAGRRELLPQTGVLSAREDNAIAASTARADAGSRWKRFLIGSCLVATGVAVGLAAAALLYWDRLGSGPIEKSLGF